MKQSKQKSLVESTVQTIIGLATSIVLQVVLYPILGIPVCFTQNLILTEIAVIAQNECFIINNNL